MVLNHAFYEIQNGKIHVSEMGSGQPVLFIHGAPDSSSMWRDVIEQLPSGYRYIAPDLPGFGQSAAAPDFNWSLANRGQWVADLLQTMGISEPAILVGHDHGGGFVAPFAIQYPDRVSKIVLQNTVLHADYRWHSLAKVMRTPILGEFANFWMPYPIMLPFLVSNMKSNAPGLSKDYIAGLQKTITHQMGTAMLKLYRASSPSEFKGWEEKLNALIAVKPTLVIWGEHDHYIPLWVAKRWEKCGAKLLQFPDGGHWLAIEKPSAYAQQLTAFF